MSEIMEEAMARTAAENEAQKKEFYFLCFHNSEYSANKCARKSEIFSYDDLLRAVKRTEEPPGKEAIIAYLVPYNGKSEEADPPIKITAVDGNEWVNYCKGKEEHTWFKVMCYRDPVAEAANSYTDDPDYTNTNAIRDSFIEPITDYGPITNIIDGYTCPDAATTKDGKNGDSDIESADTDAAADSGDDSGDGGDDSGNDASTGGDDDGDNSNRVIC